MEVSEEMNTPQSENILHCFMILTVFVIPIKADGMGLAARVHLITYQDLQPALLLNNSQRMW